jgi:hypothetical protein
VAHLLNVKEEIRANVARSSLATEVCNALDGLFTIESYKRHEVNDWKHIVLHCKPTRTIADALLLGQR